MTNSLGRTQLTQWQRLQQLAKQAWNLSTLFADDADARVARFQANACGIHADFSKQLLDAEVWRALIDLAVAVHLQDKTQAMLAGEVVNLSENRPALHTALRIPKKPVDLSLSPTQQNIHTQVHASLDAMAVIVEQIRGRLWRGFAGDAITDVVNLGVGGSDLGPLMARSALAGWANTDIQVHFVSNMDGGQLEQLLNHLNPKTTLFIIASKSFSTLDTLSNAETALAWLIGYAPSQQSALRRHFIGVSANESKMTKWGIPKQNQLIFWEWVGGRFSMWSVIGLAVAISIGMTEFRAMLAGAHDMDRHFATAPYEQNIPILMGLIGVWNSTFLGINAHTVLPYDGRLKYLPSYLTQLEMESNGKSATTTGHPIDFSTCPILWGEVGSNAQHAFYQLLHQGTQKVSCDFIASIERYHNPSQTLKRQHLLTLANCLAQSRVLAFGNQSEHPSDDTQTQDLSRKYRGNQPSTTLLLDELTPSLLGSLVALYEHKVYVMACIWNINPFDQWGVEMGKKVALDVFSALTEPSLTNESTVQNRMSASDTSVHFDASTQALLAKILNH